MNTRFCIKIVSLVWIASCIVGCKTSNLVTFNKTYNSLENNNYFKAKELYETNRGGLSRPYRLFTEAALDNAFNKLKKSEDKIEILSKRKGIPDSLLIKLYETKYDNAIKLYHYKEAKNTAEIILRDYKKYLDKDDISDYENALNIWSALEDTAPQTIDLNSGTKLKMGKDIAGLNTLKVSSGKDTIDCIFDTGANLSTTSQSVAKQLNMNIIPVEIKVGTITGTNVTAQLAVCDTLALGNINIFNVVFLVLPDESLSFPQSNYKIYGILGFPLIEALREIQITRSGYFVVPQKESLFSGTSNMALNGLIPLIYMDKKYFTFDTGADMTILYHKFYVENRDNIEKYCQLQKIKFAGAGGRSEFDGYKMDYTFKISNREITLKNVDILKEKIKSDEKVYGNIGQDLIRQFDTMTLNFKHMFIKFE